MLLKIMNMAEIFTENLLREEICNISRVMFEKNFFGAFHGSISAKLSNNRFFINSYNACFGSMATNDIVTLYSKKDYRWNEASMDTPIHVSIYQNLSDAKSIAFCFPIFTMNYSAIHDVIIPHDYFGSKLGKEFIVYNPRNFESWHERAEVEIYRFFKEKKTRIMIIRDYGVFVYARDLIQLVKTITILENTCQMLYWNIAISS